MTESRGKSRKHKLTCLRDRADSLDLTSDGTSSTKGNSCGGSDEVSNTFCHQLSTLTIPNQQEYYGSYDYPPRKKLKRRKNRKAKRTRVKSAVQMSESSDVTPTSPASSHMKSNTSDDTVVEAMLTGAGGYDSSDSSLSLGHITDLGGTDADDELSCWEGTGVAASCLFSSGDEAVVDKTDNKKKEKEVRSTELKLEFLNKTLSEVKQAPVEVKEASEDVRHDPLAPQLKSVARRERMKTRSRPAARNTYHGGSSTSSPSMTKDQASTIDRVIKRRYVVDYMSVVDGAGPSNAMQTGD